MKRLLIAGLLITFWLVPGSNAQSSFGGTWKVDFKAAMPTKVNVWLLQNGTYKCTSCAPIIDVKADGKDQPVKGQPFDTISVTVVDDHTVKETKIKMTRLSAMKNSQSLTTKIPSQMNSAIGN